VVTHSTKPWKRAQRVGPALRSVVCEFLLRHLKDPRVGGVEVTGVDVSPDLRNAVIHYLLRDRDSDRDQIQSGLESAAPAMQKFVGETLRLRRVPKIKFQFDTSVEEAERIDALLDDMREEEEDSP